MKRQLSNRALTLFLLASISVSGCNAIPGYAEYNAAAKTLALEGIKEYQSFHDDARNVWLLVGCDTSIGSLSREPDPIVREFLLRNPRCPTMTTSGLGGSMGSAVYMGAK